MEGGGAHSFLLEKTPFQKKLGTCTQGSKQEVKHVVSSVKDGRQSNVRVFVSSLLKDTECLTGMGSDYCVPKQVLDREMEPQRHSTYLRICALNEDLDQPARSR